MIPTPDFPTIFNLEFIRLIFGFIGSVWFLWLPPILWFLFFELWLGYIRALYKKNIEWVLLEIRIPRETLRTPKAMEQFFSNIYPLRNVPTNFIEKYWDGEVTLWFSLEIASFGGEIHFYLRTPKKHRNAVEANIYAQYPEVEVAEVNDYTDNLPLATKELYQEGFDFKGADLVLGRDDVYPIRTYTQFASAEESENLDPISSLLEILGRLKKEEQVWLQILIRPADPSAFKAKGDSFVKELKSKQAEASKEGAVVQSTPGEIEAIKAIEKNVSKPGFESQIRYLYFAPRGIIDSGIGRAILTSFNQYSSPGLNYFLPNIRTKIDPSWMTFPYFFVKSRGEARRQRMLQKYRLRLMPEEMFSEKAATSSIYNLNFAPSFYILNTEELATIYHIPTNVVLTAPVIKRIESKKVGPPAGLPIYGGEEEELVRLEQTEEVGARQEKAD